MSHEPTRLIVSAPSTSLSFVAPVFLRTFQLARLLNKSIVLPNNTSIILFKYNNGTVDVHNHNNNYWSYTKMAESGLLPVILSPIRRVETSILVFSYYNEYWLTTFATSIH